MKEAKENVKMEVKGNILTIKVDISERFGKSSSGKTTIIASTQGNVSIPEHDDVKIGLNIYTK
jgi:ABC-type molybdate transport system ATPase subunit